MKIFGGGAEREQGGYVKTVLILAAVGASPPLSGNSFWFQASFRNFGFLGWGIFLYEGTY